MDFTKLSFQIFSQLELNWLKNHHNARILPIDGGGLLFGQAFLHLESQIQSKTCNPDARIPDLFDLIADTGMGGVLAALLTLSNPNSTRPLFSTKQALDFVHFNHRRLFRPSGLLRRRFAYESFNWVVLFTYGMDTRPFRLNWPISSAIYDVSPGSVFQFASQRLKDVGAKISRTCMLLLHVPSESSNIHERLCEKGFNGNRPSICALQGLPLMTSASFNDLLFLVSCLAMKGSIFLGDLPSLLLGTEFGNMVATRKWMESLFMSHGFQVSIVSYAEVARKLHLEPPTENLCNFLFVTKQL